MNIYEVIRDVTHGETGEFITKGTRVLALTEQGQVWTVRLPYSVTPIEIEADSLLLPQYYDLEPDIEALSQARALAEGVAFHAESDIAEQLTAFESAKAALETAKQSPIYQAYEEMKQAALAFKANLAARAVAWKGAYPNSPNPRGVARFTAKEKIIVTNEVAAIEHAIALWRAGVQGVLTVNAEAIAALNLSASATPYLKQETVYTAAIKEDLGNG